MRYYAGVFSWSAGLSRTMTEALTTRKKISLKGELGLLGKPWLSFPPGWSYQTRLVWKLPSGWLAVFEEGGRSWQPGVVVQLWWKVFRLKQLAKVSHVIFFACCHYFVWLVCKRVCQIPALMREWLFCMDTGHWCGFCPWQLILEPAQCLLRSLFSCLWVYFKVRFPWAFLFVGLCVLYLMCENTVPFYSEENCRLLRGMRHTCHWWWTFVHVDREDVLHRDEGFFPRGWMR